MKRLLLFPLVFFLLQFSAAQSRKLTYRILSNGEEIGEIYAVESKDGGLLSYNLNTEVQTEKIIKVNLRYVLKSRYQEGKLVYSYMQNYTNGKEQSYAEVKWDTDEGYYFISKDKEKDDTEIFEEERIEYSIAKLYFEHPKDRKQVFSEKFASYVPLTKLEEDSYELKLPDGRNVYHYKDGLCHKAEIFNFLAKLVFELVEVK